jgi:hypothetical protein
MTELERADGVRVLYSYDTPVAALSSMGCYVKTDRWFSRTTSAHISRWLDGSAARTIPHDEIVRLAEGE